jgi:DNA invertase Pin-like site-specific DNA recombinase
MIDPPKVLEMPRIAYSLIRWSDPTQRKGHSQERQDNFAGVWCQAHGVRLDDSMCMVLDGQSAFRGHHRKHSSKKLRPLADFLDAIRTGRVSKGSILILENIDRLSREEIDEAWELFRSILKAGVDVVTETPERWYTRESLNDLFSILEVKFCMYRAHEESLMKSKRVRAAWEKKKRVAAETRSPITRQCPPWIVLTEGSYRLIEERAEIVRRIFRMAINGLGVVRIARILTEGGVECFGREGKWLPQYVRRILRNRAAYGTYSQGTRDFQTGKQKETGEIVEGFYPGAVSESEWQAAQRAISSRYRTSGRPGEGEANLFTGILWDADSRERMQKEPTWVDGVKYEYLIPARAKQKRRIPYKPIEEGIVRILGKLRPEDILQPGQEIDARLRRLGELTNEVMALADRLTTLEAQQNDPNTDPDLLPSVQRGIVEVRRRHRERAKELQALEEEVHTNRTKSLGACQSVLGLLDTPERRRIAKARIRQLVEEIWIMVQPIHRNSRIIHVQLYLRGGGGRPLYRQIWPLNPPPSLTPWQLGACDFRAGDVGHAARNAGKAQLLD